MLGTIETYNEVHEIGLIKGTNEKMYSFGPNEWDVPSISPKLKMEVRFNTNTDTRWKKAYDIQLVVKSPLTA